MSEPALLAEHIDERAETILAVWRAAVTCGGDVPEAERLSYAEFVDHVPELLDRLAERLRGQPSDALSEGKKHGRVRRRQGYDIAEIVKEYGHLRTALGRATVEYARQHGWDLARLEEVEEAINDVLNEATAESVRQFQEDSREETQAALAEAKKRQAATEEAWFAAHLEKAKLRTILGSLPVAVWMVDAGGMVVAADAKAERLQRPSESEGSGPVTIDDLGPDDPVFRTDGSPFPHEELPLARALRGETVTQEELVWRVRGETRTVTINAVPLADAAGTIVGAVAVVQDVTPRKRAEELLRHQNDFARAITETLGEGLCTIDGEGRVTFANPAALRMFGWDEAELIGKNLHEAVHHQRPEGTPHPVEECPKQGVLHTGETVRGDDVFFRKDGSPFFVAYTASPILTDGRVTGVVEVFRDITERKQLEARLAASEAQFRNIAEKLPVMVWRTNSLGFCDYLNQTWGEFRGRGMGHDLGESWVEGVHPDDRPACLARSREAFDRREPFEMTYRLLREDGQYRWISDRGTPYFDPQGAFLGYLGTCMDITEQEELKRKLEEASRHKTRLVSALSHDARTPLNAVFLSAQLLEIQLDGAQDAEVQQCLRTIRHSVRNVLDLLGDLLNLSRIDAGAMPAEVTRFPLEPCLAECLASIEPQARLKGLDVRLEPGDLADTSLETDRSKLKQILANLLSNALRYTERGHIRIYGERTPEAIRIAVEDTGTGIAPADQSRIFDEFAVLENARREPGEGTGLGLAICRRLAELLQGEITLHSDPGVGSTFALVLPKSVLTLNLPRPSDNAPFETPAGDQGAVLIAEDHPESRQTLAKVLRRMGYRVLEADNGRDALTLAERERLHAVLMDVNMPVMDGIEATLALRSQARFRDLPIFALTGDVTLDNQRRIGEAGVDGYLEKPVTWDALRQALGSLGNRSRRGR
jgi:PAS domain S-box-containing protein